MKNPKINFRLIISSLLFILVISAKAADDPIARVYHSYLKIKESLAKDNAAEAQAQAKALVKALGTAKIEKKEDITKEAQKIAATRDIKAQRAAFSPLSEDLTEVLKKNTGSIGNAYKQYCPMALNKKGAYWLSDKKEIENPYMGKKMQKCGVVKGTIK